MVKHVSIILLILFFLIIPTNVSAGIICNDGWESSCLVSGPGCCSHHGGVSNYSNTSSNNYKYSDESSGFIDDLEDEQSAGILIIVILGILILVGIFNKDESKKK